MKGKNREKDISVHKHIGIDNHNFVFHWFFHSMNMQKNVKSISSVRSAYKLDPIFFTTFTMEIFIQVANEKIQQKKKKKKTGKKRKNETIVWGKKSGNFHQQNGR